MKRTPDIVSKHRQELNRQIAVWENRIQLLNSQIVVGPESFEKKQADLANCKKSIADLKRAIVKTQKFGRPLNLDFKKQLYTGVF